jgi:alkylation response protein AidB-like acyl-CoA dehydrogenase
MDFSLNEDQVAIQDAARAFAEGQLAPHSAEWDEKKHFPVDVLRQAAQLGFAGIYVNEDVGGSDCRASTPRSSSRRSAMAMCRRRPT